MFSKITTVNSSFIILIVFAGSLAAAQTSAPTVAPSSSKALCSALTPADFTKAGVPVSTLKQANLDNSASAYCVYESQAKGVEFDIFFPAGDSDAEITATETTVWKEVGGRFEPVHIAGADDARSNAAAGGHDGSATIAVRKGKAVFDINIPAGPKAQQQLLKLAQTVLSRLRP